MKSIEDDTAQFVEILLREGDEVLEFFKSKGSALEGVKREYLEMQSSLELLADSIVDHEREVEAQQTEIVQIHDQMTVSRRNIDENLATEESLQANIETLRSSKIRLMEREMHNRIQIQIYAGKFEALRESLDVGSGWTPQQEEEKNNLEKERDFVTKKLDSRNNVVAGLRADVDKLYELIQETEAEIATLDGAIAKSKGEIADLNGQCDAISQRGKDSEKNIKSIQQAIVQAEADYIQRKTMLKSDEKTFVVLDRNIKTSKERMDGYIREFDAMLSTTQQLTNELEKQIHANKNLSQETDARETYLEEKSRELAALSKEDSKLQKLKEIAQKKIEEIEAEKAKAEAKRDELIKQVEACRDEDTKQCRKEVDTLLKSKADLEKQIDILRKKYLGSDRSTRAIIDLGHVNQSTKRNLAIEKKILQDEVALQFNQIQQFLHDNDKYDHDTELTNQEYYTALEELKLQELQVRELQKKISDDQGKLKQKQNLYEAVRADRNLYSKQLIDSQEEIADLRKKFRSTNHQIDQMKEEISSKDHSIVKEHFHHHAVDKERELLKNELTKIRKQVLSAEQIIENQHVEVLKLSRIIEEADAERQRQQNELVAIISERNLLTAQVVKRNSELGHMYDKIKVQRSNLRIGEQHYNVVLKNLRDLQRQLVNIVQEHHGTVNELKALEDAKRNVYRLEKELLQEQSKTQALSDELARPMNVHRWRILESSDPKRFEKIKQIQTLQKELIDKSDEVVRKELLIQEKEKVYVELKNIISRQPGPEVEEQIVTYQLALKDKVKQLAAMNDELDMYRQQVQTYKEEIMVLDERIASMKKTWLKTKRLRQ